MTLNEWADTCLNVYKPNLKADSHYAYTYKNRMKNTILLSLGDMPIEEIKPIDCQKCINLQKGNSSYQISQTKQIMNFLFERAIDNNIIGRNPARNIIKPNGTKTTRRSLTNNEREVFLSAIQDAEYLPFAIMYYCGLRPSEVLNVRTTDIVDVAGAEAFRIRGTKSINAIRVVPIPRNLSTLIQNSLKSANRGSQGYLCNISYETFKNRWKRLRKLIGGTQDLVPYCLRHTYCTDLLRKGIDLRIAQKLMGHSSIDLTSTIYSHFDEDLFTITAEKLDEFGAHYECEG